MPRPEDEFPIETVLPSGIRVFTCRKAPGTFETAAVFQGKLLNLLLARNPVRALHLHRLLSVSWGAAEEIFLVETRALT